MTTDIIERLPMTSASNSEDRITRLRELFPEAFGDGRIDFDALRRFLGDQVDTGKERFGLQWPGKSDCLRVIQEPSVGTLLPMRDESVNFDATENLIIEGDNLEVLKLLQKSYYGKVKLIYIDPPYNTGNEFIYPDNFREGLQDYLKYSGQVDGDGFKTSTNSESAGRYHSKWLSMMYPRLFLARNLLRDDGMIFVSIDDHELHNLRALMNEVFGPENFISIIVVQSNKRGQTYNDIAKTHEYIVIYARGDEPELFELNKAENSLPYSDSRGPFDLWELRNRNPKFGKHNRPNLFFPIYVAPSLHEESGHSKVSLTKSDVFSVEVLPRNSEGTDGCWRWGVDKIRALDLGGVLPVLLGKQRRDGGWNIYEKSRKSTTKAKSLWDETAVISEQGTMQIGELGLAEAFDHPKPVGLIRKCLNIAVGEDDIVLDFFAGSGTTAHAAMAAGRDEVQPRYILVQLPEKADGRGFPTIAAITRERVRRVITKLDEADNGRLALEPPAGRRDRGFRAFKLAASNFKPWDGNIENVPSVAKTLELFAEHVVDGRTGEDILVEVLLKAGFPLTASVERLTLAGKQVFSVAEGALLVCLDRELTLEVIEAMVQRAPAQIVCLDAGFQRNDQLKVNAVQAIKSRARSEETTIVLRVV